MAANALQGADEADDAIGGRAARAPGATSQSTDEAVQASLARLSRLMESAREQVIAAARLEAAADGHVEGAAEPAGDRTEEVAASPDRLPTAEFAAPAPPPADPPPSAPPSAPRRAMSPAAAALLDDPVSFVAGRVVAATAEIEARLRAAFDSRMDELSGGLAGTQARMDAAELRSLDAIEDLGRRVEETSRRESDARAAEASGAEAVERLSAEVTRIGEALKGGLERLDGGQAGALETLAAELSRIGESVEARLKQSEADQARALQGLDEKLGRVSERLAERIGGADWRSARANEEMGETLARACERLSRDLIERIELGEGRTVAMFVQARDEIELPVAAPAQEQAPPAWSGHTAGESSPRVASIDMGEQVSSTESAQVEAPGGFLPAFSTLVAQPAEPEHGAAIDEPVEPDLDVRVVDAASPAITESLEDLPPPPAKTGFWRGFNLTKSGTSRNP